VHRHDCYMPLIHLKFKHVVSDAAGGVEWPLISAAASAANRHSSKDEPRNAGLDHWLALLPKHAALPGPMAEWLRRGLQILARRFDSGSGLHFPSIATARRTGLAEGGRARCRPAAAFGRIRRDTVDTKRDIFFGRNQPVNPGGLGAPAQWSLRLRGRR
jgi:hypothetical protein